MIEKYFNIAIGSSTVTRYSMKKMMRDESVMEHTGCVALFALFIAKDCIKNGTNVNIETLLTRALIHDLDEHIIGDIVNTTKHANEEVLTALNNMAEETICKIMCNIHHTNLICEWRNQKDETIEGRILKYCDLFSVVMKCYEEITSYSNKSAIPVLKNCEKNLLILRGKEENETLITAIDEALIICVETLR